MDVKYLKVIVGEKSETFPISTLSESSGTYLGIRVNNLEKFNDIRFEGETAICKVYFTPRFFEDVRDWHYTRELRIPFEGEADLFYKVMDFWVIPYEKKILLSTGTTLTEKIDECLKELKLALPKCLKNIRGLPGPPGPVGPMGLRGPPGERGVPGPPDDVQTYSGERLADDFFR